MSANEAKDEGSLQQDSTNKSEEKPDSSMTSLIIWNVTKALNNNPSLDLKTALSMTRLRLEGSSYNVNATITQHPEDRNLICALLAWQQLGHKNSSSLYSFIESTWKQLSSDQSCIPKAIHLDCKQCEDNMSSKMPLQPQIRDYISYRESAYSNSLDSSSFALNRMGPVVKLPVEERLVMHLQNTCCNPSKPQNGKNSSLKHSTKNIMDKIDAACCVESACQDKLAEVEAGTKKLRERAERLAKREAERVELLERAEAAWRELEHGYQRRLKRAEDQGEDLLKQIQKLVEERKGYRNACSDLGQKLKCRGGHAEGERERLAGLEQQVYEHACARHRLAEEAARADAVLADYQCKVAQLDRDLQFKEEQTRCKRLTQTSELDSARALTHEAERVMHAELSNLKEHLAQASAELLQTDKANHTLMNTVEELKREKNELLEDLETCQEKCDDEIKDKIELLKQKQQELSVLKEKVLQCRCKVPVEAAAEVHRTPSLAALCCCEPEDRFLDSCSCTSLRSKLMNDLLADLFSGLQGELGSCAADMPCQLLKCLEEKHSWDRASPVKTNIEKFFAKLLISELDIAIATSIEKYHAKWVGTSCVDAGRLRPDPADESEGWEQRAIERRAQKLAATLAEQLFQQRADQLNSKAMEIIKANPPCDCPGPSNAVYQCTMKPNSASNPFVAERDTTVLQSSTPANASLWRRTQQTVSQLKYQIDNLKMESLKKQDLRKIEQNIAKLLQRGINPEKDVDEHTATDQKYLKKPNNNFNQYSRIFGSSGGKSNVKKRLPDGTVKKVNRNTSTTESHPDKSKITKPTSYAINLCLCSTEKNLSNSIQQSKSPIRKQSISQPMPTPNLLKQKPSVQQDVNKTLTSSSKISAAGGCPNNCACFHKAPSNSSIDKFLDTLTKWKNELTNSSADIKSGLGIQKDILRKNSVTFSDITEQTLEKDVKKCQVKTCNINLKSSLTKLNNNTEIETPLPGAKDSEYLRSVNLDKSTELCCKCKESLDYLPNKNEDGLKIQSIDNGFNNRTTVSQNKLSQQKIPNEKRESLQKEYNVIGDSKSSAFQNNMKNISNTSIPEDCDCEYKIKFLGATITNDEPSQRSSNYNILNIGDVSSNLCDCRNIGYPCLTNPKHFATEEKTPTKSKLLVTQSFNVQVNSEPMNNNTNNEVQNEDYYENLRANTFELLREHLTEKIEECKKNVQYSGIPKEEENKLCSTILHKIKQVISDSTSNRPYCQCSVELASSDRTWSRAYNLLQEYLKTKLKRVQCICVPQNAEVQKKNVLPDLLTKINDMIERDISKLRDYYGTKLNDNDFNIPEKDTNIKCEDVREHMPKNASATCFVSIPETVSKQISNSKLLLTENMSTQVPFMIGMDSKYCATGSDNGSKIEKCNFKQYSNSCSCTCFSCYDFPAANELIIYNYEDPKMNETVHRLNEANVHNQLPYIGYTIECSCVGKLDSCVCSKALSLENEKIKNIWNDVAKCNINNNVSYIMKKVLGSIQSETKLSSKRYCEPSKSGNFEAESNKYCNTEVLASNDDQIVLTKSFDDNVDVECKTTNTLVNDLYKDISQIINPLVLETVELKKNLIFLRKCRSDYFPNRENESSLDVEKIFGRHCDCSMIPICHVKMLMESIENKLAHSKCTCDSLSSSVCPVHSRPN